jgi:hypothetical protein
MQHQAIYELNEDNESNGVVHNFCSPECLLVFTETHSYKFIVDINGCTVDGEQCDSCGERLDTPRTQSSKFHFFNQCDRWRIRYLKGEDHWQEMMKNKIPVSQSLFEISTIAEDLLDEDESLSDFVSSDPEHGFYISSVNSEPVFFIQHSGFEFIFTENGKSPYNDELKS